MEKKRKNMVMTDAEIVRSWKEAKDRIAQVRILAELNVCSRDVIIEILKSNGIDGRQLPRKKKAAPFVLSDKPAGETAIPAEVEEETAEAPVPVDAEGEEKVIVVKPAEGIVAEALHFYRDDLVRTVDRIRDEYNEIMVSYANKINDIDMMIAGVKVG